MARIVSETYSATQCIMLFDQKKFFRVTRGQWSNQLFGQVEKIIKAGHNAESFLSQKLRAFNYCHTEKDKNEDI